MKRNEKSVARRHRVRRPYAVRTVVSGEELEQMKLRMREFFGAAMAMEDLGTGFPRWNSRPTRLVEVAWVLCQWQVFTDEEGRPLSFKTLARLLCEKLHTRQLANIYDVGYRCRLPGHRCIVDNFATDLREGGIGLGANLYWSEPLQFPPLRSYRGVFLS